MGKLLEELKRRKVFRVAVVYAVIAWLLIQVADTIAPMMNLPESAPGLVLFLLIIFFPIALFLAWSYDLAPEGISPNSGSQRSTQVPAAQSQLLVYATFALVLLVLGFQLSDRFFSGDVSPATRPAELALTTADSAVMRSSIILNQSLPLIAQLGVRTALSVAPNGSALAYSNTVEGGVFLRDLATQQTQEIFSGIGFSQFSPSGQQLLVFSLSTGEIMVMPTQGGGLRSLPIQSGVGPPIWLSDEILLYRDADGLKAFSLTDGTDELIPGFDTVSGLILDSLPSESAFLFTQTEIAGLQSSHRILAYDLSNQSSKAIIDDGYWPQYVNSGHVVFSRDGDLWAVPFDPDVLEVTGAETVVLEGVESGPLQGVSAYSISDFGRLVYLPGREYVSNQTVLFWADRLGNRTELSLRAGNYGEPRLSPNGELLALTSFQSDGSSDVWVHDFANGAFTPVTFSGSARSAVWTPDGSRLVYQQNTVSGPAGSPRGELWIMNANGTGQAERILEGPAKADSFSPIDEKLIYMTGVGSSEAPDNLSTLTLSDGSWIAKPLFSIERTALYGRVSPDGRWIAYTSSESGSRQVYIQPYPNLEDGRWRISSNELSAQEPMWGPNSDELFFRRNDGNGSLMHSEITIEGDSISSGVVRPLLTDLRLGSAPTYAVSNDGERFLHFYSGSGNSDSGIDQDHTEVVVIEKFFEELKRLAPPDSQ